MRTCVVVVCTVLTLSGCGSTVEQDRLLAASRGDLDATVAPAAPLGGGGPAVQMVPGAPVASPGVVAGPATSAAGGTAKEGGGTRSGTGKTAGAGPAGGGGEAKATGPTCTGPRSTLTIGAVGEQTGLVGATLGGGPQAVKAWVAHVNSRGGVACHPLRYIVADDGGDPAKHASLVQQLVEQDGVIAFVQMNATLAGQSAISYLENKGIPVIGGEGASPWFYESPVYFPQAAAGDDFVGASIIAEARQAKAGGKTKFGSVACIEATICSIVNKVVDSYIQRVPGVSVVYKGSASLTAPDYTAQCLNARDAGVEAIMLAFEYTGIQRFARSCAAVNFRPMFGTVSQAAQPQIATDPNLDGLVIATNTSPWFDPKNPAIVEHNRVMNQFGVLPSASTVQGWVSALLFAAVMAKVPAEPTSKDLLTALGGVRNNDLGGTTGPLTFRSGENHRAPLCYFPVQLRGGDFVSLNGFKRVCE